MAATHRPADLDADTLGRRPTVADIRAADMCSMQPIYRNFGSLREALAAAGILAVGGDQNTTHPPGPEATHTCPACGAEYKRPSSHLPSCPDIDRPDFENHV